MLVKTMCGLGELEQWCHRGAGRERRQCQVELVLPSLVPYHVARMACRCGWGEVSRGTEECRGAREASGFRGDEVVLVRLLQPCRHLEARSGPTGR